VTNSSSAKKQEGVVLRITVSSDDIRAEVGITGENVHLINEFSNTILRFPFQRKRTVDIFRPHNRH